MLSRQKRARKFNGEKSMYNNKKKQKNSLFQQSHCNAQLKVLFLIREISFRNSKRFHVVGAQDKNHNMAGAGMKREAEYRS